MAPLSVPDREEICEQCRHFSQTLIPQMRHSADFIQGMVTGNEKTRIAEWADGLAGGDLYLGVAREGVALAVGWDMDRLAVTGWWADGEISESTS